MLDGDSARGHPHHRGAAAAARHHRLARRQARLRLRLGRRPRAGLRRRDLRGAAEPALGAGPGALRAAARAATRSTSPTRTTTSSPSSTSSTRQVLAEVPVGRRARGHGREPGRQDRGQHLRDHQHGAPDRHRDLRDRRQRPGRQRGRALPQYTPDGRLLCVSAEIGGTVSVIDTATQRGRPQDHLRGARRAARGAAAGRHPGHRGRHEGLRRARAGEPRRGGRRRDAGR